jgi:L-threonylcarbamoyladenylate synthase
MRIINFDEFNLSKLPILTSIRDGSLFIHPTDTIYGIGCNACNSKSVKKVRELKSRISNPLSVIAPSVNWIRENCVVTEVGERWLRELPGPYTLIFKTKRLCVADEVNNGLRTLGVRIPKHQISKVVAGADVPIVSTSVNKSSEEYMTSLEDLDPSIKSGIDFLLYEGKKEGRPSKIIDLTKDGEVTER